MDNRDPEIEKTIEDIRQTVDEAQKATREQVDISSEIDRLFLLYQSGSVLDQRKTNDTLLVARASKKLDLLQFRNLATKVKQVKEHFGDKKKAEYQKELWSLTSSKGSAWSKFDSPDFSPNRNASNEPIANDSDQSLPDVSELLPESFRDGSPSPISTPITDLLRSQEQHPDSISSMDRIENAIGKFGLRFPDFKSASYTRAESRELGSHQYYNQNIDDLAKGLSTGGSFAANAHEVDRSLFTGNANRLGQPMPDMEQAKQWAEGLHRLHESRIKNIAEKHGAQKSSPVYAETKEQAKSYSAEALEQIQQKQATGTSVPQVDTPGAFSSVEAPPVQTAENRAIDASVVSPDSSDKTTSGDDKKGMSWLDWIQLGLDGVGIAEPTPFADLANTGVSLGRAMLDPENAGQHLVNAGISLVSTIPYAGDVAKLAKGYGKGGKAVGNTIEGFANSKIGQAASKMFGVWQKTGMGGINGKIIPGSGGASGSGSPPILPGTGGSGGESGSGGGLSSFWPLAAITTSLVVGFNKLHQWVLKTAESGRELIESQRDLAKYSGELSSAFAKSDTRTVMRDIKKAEYLDSSASSLLSAQSAYNDAKAFRDAPGQRTNNNLRAMATYIATIATYVQSFTSIKSIVERGFYGVIDAVTGGSNEARSGLESLFQKLDEEFAEKKKPPVKEPPRLPADGKQVGGMNGMVLGRKVMP